MLFMKFKTSAVEGKPRCARVIFTDHPEHCRGHYLIKITDPSIPDEDVLIAAELFAIQKAFTCAPGLANRPKSGRSLQLQVSFGSILKLKTADSEKRHLVDYAHAIATKYAQADVTVNNAHQPWMSLPLPKAELFTVDAPTPDYVFCTALRAGVKVTRHALERLSERAENYKNSKDLYLTAISSLGMQGKKLECITPCEHAVKKARAKYRVTPVFVYDHINAVYLILTKKHNRYDLVTAIANSEYSDYSILGR
ncbi:hypothetical protein NT239_01860 [Chitinibacter sp. SCUT-21]|uniref:hypothetical protein n=1 Tax=Chitinibacter sp. SCUT-21 TaxID=2970891 RepID=UPI0035A5A562